MAIKWYKDQQLTNDIEGDVDEYLDAFVALGGQPDKDGFISKDVLVEIIKAEFELTIDMVVSTHCVHSAANALEDGPDWQFVIVGVPEEHRRRN